MNKFLEQLVNLSQLDKQIDGYAPRIEAINKDLIAKKAQIETTSEQISQIDAEINDVRAQITSTNIHIGEFNSKLQNIAKKSNSVKNEKEIKALNLEEELAKDQLEAANEEIGRLERIIESKNIKSDELRANIKNYESELEKLKGDVSQELAKIEDERKKIYSQKEDLLSKMNQKIITFYEKIRKWAKNTAVVEVRKQACYGCFMRINDKTYANVLKSDEIIACPHCGRILYSQETPSEPKTDDKNLAPSVDKTEAPSAKTPAKKASAAAKKAVKSSASDAKKESSAKKSPAKPVTKSPVAKKSSKSVNSAKASAKKPAKSSSAKTKN